MYQRELCTKQSSTKGKPHIPVFAGESPGIASRHGVALADEKQRREDHFSELKSA